MGDGRLYRQQIVEDTAVADWKAAGDPATERPGRATSSRKPMMVHLNDGMRMYLQYRM